MSSFDKALSLALELTRRSRSLFVTGSNRIFSPSKHVTASVSLRHAEITVIRRLLCEIHPRLRECGEAVYWDEVIREIMSAK